MKKATIPSIILFCFAFLQLQAAKTTAATMVFSDSLILNCPQPSQIIGDTTENNSNYWNQNYYWDASINSHDLCEGFVDLNITATGTCLGAGTQIQYLLFLDLNGDDSTETVVNSAILGNAGLGWNNVLFGNAGNPNYSGGTPYKFDATPIPINQLNGFALKITGNGPTRTASVRWNTKSNQNQYVIPQLPYGKHHIKWIIRDTCGNEKTCTSYFQVKDTKKPTIVCLPALSVNLLGNVYPTSIQLWASDFLQYTTDNCSPDNKLKIAYRKKGQGTGFPLDTMGNPQVRQNYYCNELGIQEVELWSIDIAGNANHCNTTVSVNDNNYYCGGEPISFYGNIFTEQGDPLQGANVEIFVSGNQIPSFSSILPTNTIGNYNFNFAPENSNLKITPFKDDNPLNGVSTYDLVLISKHVLGIDLLNSPYKMIAADINRSNSITTFDIIEARKLILGIYNEFPNNSSWRFVDQYFVFPNPNNAFQSVFPENITIPSLNVSTPRPNFIAVKTGDLNGNAIASGTAAPEDRTDATLLFTAENYKVKAGETFTLHFTAAERVQAYQFTLHFQNLTLLNVQPLTRDMNLSNFGIFEQALTTSYNGDETGAFDLTFRAQADGQISDFLYLSDKITPSIAYQQDQRMKLGLQFKGPNADSNMDAAFEVYPCSPNPMGAATRIGVSTSTEMSVKLEIFDLTGRLLHTQQNQFGKGYHQFIVNRTDLPENASGVLFYKVGTAAGSITKKMILLK